MTVRKDSHHFVKLSCVLQFAIHCQVNTAEKMCKQYNEHLRAERSKVVEAENAFARKVVDGEIDPQAAALAVKQFPELKLAPEKLSKCWAFRFRKAFGWVKRATNTSGVYLAYDHPKMRAARREFQEDLDRGIDRRLYLNVDQVWRSAYSQAKYTLRKDRWQMSFDEFPILVLNFNCIILYI